MEPSCGVAEHYVSAARLRCGQRVEHDCGGVAALAVLDDIHAGAVSPYVELINSRRNGNVSAAATTTFSPCALRFAASLPIVVVLPAPLTPITMSTDGFVSSFSSLSPVSISAMMSRRSG